MDADRAEALDVLERVRRAFEDLAIPEEVIDTPTPEDGLAFWREVEQRISEWERDGGDAEARR